MKAGSRGHGAKVEAGGPHGDGVPALSPPEEASAETDRPVPSRARWRPATGAASTCWRSSGRRSATPRRADVGGLTASRAASPSPWVPWAARCPGAWPRNPARDEAALRADARFAEAVGIIAKNYGGPAIAAILSPECRLKVKEVETISRMAPERQRYEMEQVAQGRRPFLKPAEGLPPLGTERFSEVKSRLARALGLLNWNLRDVPRLPMNPRPTPEEQEMIRDRTGKIIASAKGLLRSVAERGTTGSPRTEGVGRGGERRQAPAEGERPLKTRTSSEVAGRLGQVLGVVERNVRDIPRLSPEERPTPEEERAIGDQVGQIIEGSRELLRLVSSRGTTGSAGSHDRSTGGSPTRCDAGDDIPARWTR